MVREIYHYIAYDSPIAAKKVVNGIYKKVESLKNFPEIGYKYSDEEYGEVRILLYGHYRIAYLINEKTHTIDILGVFHGSLEIKRYLS